ncbi:unnamed protein product [Closterium sp. NIES-54]
MSSIHQRIEPAADLELVDARVGADEDSGGGLPSPPTKGWRQRQQRLRDVRIRHGRGRGIGGAARCSPHSSSQGQPHLPP